MNNRIKELRKHLNMNQTEFGARIGVKQGTIAGYENGLRTPLDTVVTSICKEFGVSEWWLRNGEGDMMKPVTREEELATLMGKLLNCEPSFKHRLIAVLLRMDPSEWEMLERKAQELFEEMKKADPEGSAGDS